MANSSPQDTYAIRLHQGQWILIRPMDDDEDNPKKEDAEEKNRKVKVMWRRKG